MRLYPRIK